MIRYLTVSLSCVKLSYRFSLLREEPLSCSEWQRRLFQVCPPRDRSPIFGQFTLEAELTVFPTQLTPLSSVQEALLAPALPVRIVY